MKQRSRKKMVRAVIIGTGLFAALSMLTGDAAFAYRKRPRTNPMGKIIVKMPKGRTTVWRGRNRYHFKGGAFHKKKKGPSGYMVVRVPIGAVALSIPVG